MKREFLITALFLITITLLLASFSCSQPAGEESTDAPVAQPEIAYSSVADGESFGLNVKLGSSFIPETLCENLADSSFPVQPSVEDSSDQLVPGTIGDGTIYFYLEPNPWDPGIVGTITLAADLQTAFSLGMITEDRYTALVDEAKELAGEPSKDTSYIAKYSAAEAHLASKRNPEVATQAGVAMSPTRKSLTDAYGEPDETIYEYGDTVLIYRGENTALAFRMSGDIGRMVLVFPAEYDYIEYREAMVSGPGDESESTGEQGAI